MKTFRKMLPALKGCSIGFLCFAAATIVVAGCRTVQTPMQTDVQHKESVSIERVRISALTEFVTVPSRPGEVQLKVLVELFDAFDLPARMPWVLRFELYEFHPLSSDPRGKRLVIWPEKDLSNAEKAGEHWRDLLRAYEFYLPLSFMPRRDKKYVLEATCFADQKRHNGLFKVQFQPEE